MVLAVLGVIAVDWYQDWRNGRTPAVRLDDAYVQLGDESKSVAFRGAMTPSAETISQLSERQNFKSWVRETGAVGLADIQSIVITLGGYDEKNEASVTGAELVDKHCEPALRGTLFESPGGGGGSPIPTVRFDLDKPVVSPKAFAKTEYKLKKGEQQTFAIETATESQACEFRVLFHVRVGTKTTTVTADDAGRPFKVTSRLPYEQYQVLYVGGIYCSGPLPYYRQDPKQFAVGRQCSKAGMTEGQTTP
ncbi:hypothetical protein ACFQ9Q_28520 [Streptomyces virginiae]|uniref:hypothetical protein n=1 Tax=Streptomyces virginiae TaxID=1961 RepID=UPI0036BCE171